jgi:hypothetical protein
MRGTGWIPIGGIALFCAAGGAWAQDLDELLERFHAGAKARLKENAGCLEADRREWERRTRTRCKKDGDCQRSARLERLAELAGLQPGINVPNEIALPSVPALVWAIAPPKDPFGRPELKSRRFRVEGTLGYNCPPECGWHIRTDKGRTYVMIGDMFLSAATAASLKAILDTPGASRFAARGFLRDEPDSQTAFDNRHCVYLHRVP